MTNNLLVIMCVGAEDPICRLFLPYWKQSGCDLLFSSPMDDPSKLEGEQHVHFGKAIGPGKDTWWHYQARWLETMKHCLTLDYAATIFTQYDSICLGPLPELTSDDCVQHVFGNNDPVYKASFFTHPPWGLGRNRLRQFVEAAERYPIETTEHGVADRWEALILEENGIKVTPSNTWSWSANAIDTPGRVAECRAAIARGAVFVHGVKNAQMLSEILAV